MTDFVIGRDVRKATLADAFKPLPAGAWKGKSRSQKHHPLVASAEMPFTGGFSEGFLTERAAAKSVGLFCFRLFRFIEEGHLKRMKKAGKSRPEWFRTAARKAEVCHMLAESLKGFAP